MTYNPYPYTMYTQNPYMSSYAAQPTQQPATSYTPPQQTQTGIIWVDGEVGAKAHQLPTGWPANTPLPLWDTNDTVIYLKSTNPMGMPNPLQKIHYRMEEQEQHHTSGNSFKYAGPALMSGEAEPQTGEYVTKDDLERMKQEIRESITEAMSNTPAQAPAVKKGAKTE